jgi:hypothetical protein
VLIVIRPGVQINAIERDALSANRNCCDVRTHVVVEAVLVHAQVSRRVAQSNEARQEFRLRILKKHRRPAKCAAPIARDELSLDANHGQRTKECQPNESNEF